MKRSSILTFLSLIIGSAILGCLAWRDSKRASVRVEWTTASELDTAGFNIYRSETMDNGFTIINEKIIHAAQDPLAGATYSFIDRDVEPGKDYYYLLEEVEMSGQTSRNLPIRVTAKADYVLNLSLAIIFFGSAVFVAVNKGLFFHDSIKSKSRPIKGP